MLEIAGFNIYKYGKKEYCEFNKTQKEYINTLFDTNLKLKDNKYKEFVLFGGYRSGKSFIQQMCVYLICCQYPNTRCLYLRNTYDELMDSVLKQFNDAFLQDEKYIYVSQSKEGS